jgi:hypothetical protein
MKTVYVVMVMDSVPYSEGSWISSIFDSEQKAYEYLSMMEELDVEEEYFYTVNQWELK